MAIAERNLKVLFGAELFGTFCLTIVYRLESTPIVFMFALWIITLLTVKISGAHNNPIFTLSEMFKPVVYTSQERDLTIKQGIVYILA